MKILRFLTKIKTISLLAFLLWITSIDKGFTQSTQCWNQLDLNTQILDYSFINPDTGWVITIDKEILKTADAGATWILINSFPVDLSFTGWRIEFVDESLGFLVPNHLTDTIYRTRDGGMNWSERILNKESYLGDINFVNTEVGYILGNDWDLFKTVDGGNNWDSFSTSRKNQGPIQFLTREIGYMGINFNTGLRKTIDGGANFDDVVVTHNFTNSDKISAPFFFVNKDTGWLAAYVAPDTDNTPNQLLYKTQNQGETWTEITSKDTLAMRAIFFLNKNVGWLIGQDGTYKTTDGGITWIEEFSFNNIQKLARGVGKFLIFDENNGFLMTKTNGDFSLYRYQPCNPPNCVTSIIEFDHNEKEVSPETSISWDIPTGTIEEYILKIGTAEGLSDIILDTVQTNTYIPESPLPSNTKLFLSIIPRNQTGSPTCDFFAFTTSADCLGNQAIVGTVDGFFCPGTSYLFKDTLITQPGSYEFLITSTIGCDSLIQLNLSHSTFPQKKLVDTLLEGTFYFWNGQKLEEEGDYIDTIPAIEGCDTIVALTLILKEDQMQTAIDLSCLAKAKDKMPNALNLQSSHPENRIFDPLSIFVTTGCPLNREDVKLRIYDRSGELIFQTKKEWEGQMEDGQKAAYGTYYYIFQYGNNQKSIIKGSVNLIP